MQTWIWRILFPHELQTRGVDTLPAQPTVLRVPKVCVEELSRYALDAPLNLDDAKAKVRALQAGKEVVVGDCTLQMEF